MVASKDIRLAGVDVRSAHASGESHVADRANVSRELHGGFKVRLEVSKHRDRRAGRKSQLETGNNGLGALEHELDVCGRKRPYVVVRGASGRGREEDRPAVADSRLHAVRPVSRSGELSVSGRAGPDADVRVRDGCQQSVPALRERAGPASGKSGKAEKRNVGRKPSVGCQDLVRTVSWIAVGDLDENRQRILQAKCAPDMGHVEGRGWRFEDAPAAENEIASEFEAVARKMSVEVSAMANCAATTAKDAKRK